MVIIRTLSLLFEPFGEFLRTFAITDIDDGAAGHFGKDVRDLFGFVICPTDDILQVLATERHLQYIRLLET